MTKRVFDRLRNITVSRISQEQVDIGNKILSFISEKDLLIFLGEKRLTYIINKEKLLKIYPSVNTEFVDTINKYSEIFEINTKERMAMFLAHSIHESAGFNKLQESFAYKPSRLLAVFPSRIRNLIFATSLVNKGKEAIANYLYNGRYGNNNVNDGWLYSGKGIGGLTFKDNYVKMYDTMKKYGYDYDIVSNPQLLLDKDIATISFMCYWKIKGLNSLADKKDIKSSTYIINGGYNGLGERDKLYKLALKIL